MGREKQVILSIGAGLILLSTVIGCAAGQPAILPIPTISLTEVKRQTIQVPSRTPTLSQLTVTPTWLLTPTSSSNRIAVCPKDLTASDEEILAVPPLLTTPTPGDLLEIFNKNKVENILNTYGADSLGRYIREHSRDHYGHPDLKRLDLTGDGLPEVIIRWSVLYIWGCDQGQYILLFTEESRSAYSSRPTTIQEIKDGNRNLIPELLLDYAGAGAYDIYEYSNGSFISLLDPDAFISVHGYGYAKYRDMEGDGISELYVYLGDVCCDMYRLNLPWRDEWDTYSWNGTYYTLARQDFSPPVYRYQAAFDGDRYTLYGEYEKALVFYQDVIFSDKLDWWSPDKANYMKRLDVGNDAGPMPIQDIDEYGYLAAYARYRIMLLYLLQGWDSDAQVVYETLQTKYPEGIPGSIFAHLAQIFREDYQVSRDMGQACQAVITDANMNSSEVLKYLGIDGFMGMSISYTTEDICPFE